MDPSEIEILTLPESFMFVVETDTATHQGGEIRDSVEAMEADMEMLQESAKLIVAADGSNLVRWGWISSTSGQFVSEFTSFDN